MAGLSGVSRSGVGKDIVTYLTEVAKHYNTTIKITSGKRTAEAQGIAMFDNWIKLKRGKVYKTSSLSASDRTKLNKYYKTAKEDRTADANAKKEAEKQFKKLASDKVGKKSQHVKGRAVDVTQSSVKSKVYKAITVKMKEIKEGRQDIYHFQSTAKIGAVTDEIKKSWPKK